MQTKRFLELLFSDLQDGELIEVAQLTEGHMTTKFLRSVEEASVHISKLSGGDVFVGACPRIAQDKTKAAVKSSQCVWTDCDETPSIESNYMMLPPSIEVFTGRGVHRYWLLQERCDDMALFESTLKQMAKAALSDPAVSDRTRRMRVPGTLNMKYPDTPKAHLVSSSSARYSLEDIRRVWLVDEKVRKRVATGYRTGFRSRSERDWSVVTTLVSVGFRDELIKEIFAAQPIGDKFREPNGDRYFEHTLRRAHERSKEASKYGFLERNDCLFRGGRQVSTFIFRPKVLLMDAVGENEDVITGDISSAGYTWKNVSLTKRAFHRVDALHRQLPLAAWQWLGSDKDLRHYLPYLLSELLDAGLPKKVATAVIGRHETDKGPVWVGTSQTLSRQGICAADEAPLSFLPTGREAPETRYTTGDSSLVQAVWNLLPKINRPEVIWPALGWTFAAPYKPYLEKLHVRFPILNVFGTRGSGKTTLILRVLLPLLGCANPKGYDVDTTPFAMLTLLGATNALPVAFTEYRADSLRNPKRFLRFILRSYDVGHDIRGRPDQTTSEYVLSSPVVVDGEDAFDDPAVLERTLSIGLEPKTISVGSPASEAFSELTTHNILGVAGDYILYTLNEPFPWEKALKITKDAFKIQLPERVLRNIAVAVGGLISFHSFGRQHNTPNHSVTPEYVHETFSNCLENVIDPLTGRTELPVDSFVEDILNAVAQSQMLVTFHYRKRFEEGRLYFQVSTAYAWWLQKRRREGQSVVPLRAIKRQLKERSRENSPGRGQYVIGSRGITVNGVTRWMVGIDISVCHDIGMDIPNALPEPFKVRVK